jgi:hypothetical protein
LIKKIYSITISFAPFLCLLHCMFVPLVISSLPLLGLKIICNKWFDIFLILLGVGFTVPSLCWGFKQHRKFYPFLTIISGLAWFYLAFDDPRHHLCFALFGGLCLFGSNILNRKLCKHCLHCKGE